MTKNIIKFIILSFLCIGCSKKEAQLSVVKEKHFEYGTSVSSDVKDYLILDDCNEAEKKEILEQSKIKIVDLEKEEGKSYPKINNYVIQIYYKDKIYESKAIVEDKTAPIISIKRDIYLKENQKEIDFFKYIQVDDLQKVDVEFQTNNVNFNKNGKYLMKVIATDESQNKSEKEITVYIEKVESKKPIIAEKPDNKPVEKPTEEVKEHYPGTTGDKKLDEACDTILDKIINKSMNPKQQCYAVYQWVEKNIRYSGTTPEGNWRKEALTILKYKKGNCLAYCYSSEALLTRLNIENIEVHDREYTHYWNMVKINNQWYHFDATNGWGTERFLWTNQQLREYSYYSPILKDTIRYEWDETAYPVTP